MALSTHTGHREEEIITKYFSNPDQVMHLGVGEILFSQGSHNDRLYLVNEGLLAGYFSDEAVSDQEMFRAEKGSFAGLQSFFSGNFTCNVTIRALRESVLHYLTYDQIPKDPEENWQFSAHFLPVVVRELSNRELAAQRLNKENEQNLKQMMLQEKMSTLGQLAKGIAHELNNAVAAMNSKTEWLKEEMQKYLREKDTRGMFRFFVLGLENGQFLSTKEIRQRRKELEKSVDLSERLTKDLAKTGISLDKIKSKSAKADPVAVERAIYYWQLGCTFHDILSTSNHAVDVVQAVRSLGAQGAETRTRLNVLHTIQRALTLLAPMTKKLTVETEFSQNEMLLTANNGELMRVWLNLIKNACEVLLEKKIANPVVMIRARQSPRHIHVHITDNGPGIPKEIEDKLFQPNFTTKKEGHYIGMGLGLTMVQKIVTAYRGRVWAESKPGQTTFKVKIPNN